MSPHSVLIVEDEQIFALDLQQRLAAMGFDAYAIAASCNEALACAAERRPDIVLMDIRIDGRRDGVETAALLRREYAVPVIYLTAHGDDATFDRAIESEPYGYLLKPVKSGELRRALEITLQRSQHEREIRERERWFSTTLSSLTDGVVTFDCDDEVQFINPAAQELARAVRGSQGHGSHLFEMACLGTSDEMVFEDKNRRERTVIRTKSLVSDEFSVLGSVMVIRDITDRIEAARHLATASRMASLGTLAAGVAHEINNPLTVIVGNSSFIHERLYEAGENHPDVEFNELIELEMEVQEAAERIRSIVSGMMVFAHPGQKVTTLASVSEVIEKAVKSTRYEVQNRAQLHLDIQTDLPKIAIDPRKLSQVLVNLIVNACQAMPSSDRERNAINVSARLDEGYLKISVTDNGTGMSEDTMQQVFDPFFTTKEVGKGTGLGLAICHGIIVGEGGTMSVQSRENLGTTFMILLPVRSPILAEALESRLTPTPSVLVVDDDSIVQRLVARILVGYEILSSPSVEQAHERIMLGERFDAILLDVRLGGIPCIEFYDKIAAIDPELGARIVFSIGGPIEAVVEARLRELPNFCVRKPYDIRNLREVMNVTANGD